MGFLSLNRRHKAGLLLVLAGAGFALLINTSFKQTLGATLLGLAGTWLLGIVNARSLYFFGSFVVFATGVLIAAVPINNDRKSYQNPRQPFIHMRQDSASGQYYGQTKEGDWVPIDQERASVAIMQHLQARPPFSIWRSAKSHEVTSIGGAVVALLGLICFFVLLPKSGRHHRGSAHSP